MASASKEALLDALSLAYLLGVYLSPLPSALAAGGRLEPLYVVAVVVAPLLAAYRLARRLRAYAEMAGGRAGAGPVLRSRAVVEWPARMKGELYLAPGEIRFVRERGLLRRRREEVLRISAEQVKDVRLAGLLSRKVVLDVAYGEGAVARYVIRVPNPELWASRIRELKGAGAAGA